MDKESFEVEAKWRLRDSGEQSELRLQLERMAATLVGVFVEVDELFDTKGDDLQRQGMLLRLRSCGRNNSLLTFKGSPNYNEGVKRRIEIEIEVSSREQCRLILGGLGFFPKMQYSKRRESWHFDEVEVLLDELPFGLFCELEGPDAILREKASMFGLDTGTCEMRDYPTLMRDYLAQRR